MTGFQLEMAFFTAALPALVVGGLLFGVGKLRPALAANPLLTGVAAILGVAVAYLGLAGGWPEAAAHKYAMASAVVIGLVALPLDALRPPRRVVFVAALAVLGLAVSFQQVLGPLAGVWQQGDPTALIAQGLFVVDAAAVALVVWLGVDHAAQHVPAPAVLGPLALACLGGAALNGITGSVTIATFLAATGVVSAVIGFYGWWKPETQVGHAAVAVLFSFFALMVLYGRFYVEVPRPSSTLVLLAPLAALGAVRLTKTLPAVAVALAVAVVPTAGGAWLAQVADQAEAAAPVDAGDDGGGSYGYPSSDDGGDDYGY